MGKKKHDDAARSYAEAQKHIAAGKDEMAIASLETCMDINPGFVEAYVELSQIFERRGEIIPAVECRASAMHLEPGIRKHKQKFLNVVQKTTVRQENPELKKLLLMCLQEPDLDFSGIWKVWSDILFLDQDFVGSKSLERLLDPFFLLGLQRLVIYDAAFEKLLTNLRHELLLNKNENLVEIARALSVYCRATEFIFYTTGAEQKLIKKFQNEKNLSPYSQAILDCYISREIPKIREDIQAITPISSGVSRAVKEQYEHYPYPRWSYIDPEIKGYDVENSSIKDNTAILVAGCGTGQEALQMAMVYPKAKVLAVDLSLASLSYAATKADEFNVGNIEFRQGDILSLGETGQTFDFIASSGVLHHLENPLEGWRVLVGLLNKGGVMRIALYSRAARKKLTEAKNIISDRNYSTDPEGIRQFRYDAPKILPPDCYNNICSFRDYYYLSECRDLLFHVQEHEYDLLEIRDMLKELNLKFLTFGLPPDIFKKYIERFPTDWRMRNLENWHKFEESYPDTFKEMYKFWCRKL